MKYRPSVLPQSALVARCQNLTRYVDHGSKSR